MKILKNKWFMIGMGVLVVYTLAGCLLGPYLTRHYVPQIIQEQLGKHAVIGKVHINPFLFKVEVNDFRMDEPDGQLIAGFTRLFVDLELKSLFKWAWTFRQVSLQEPAVRLVIDHDGALNLAHLAPPSQDQSTASSTKPRLIFQEILLDQGRIELIDQRQSKPAAVTLHPVNLQVKDISTLSGKQGLDSVTATTADGETIRWSGDLGLYPLALQGSLAFENIRTATLWQFARDSLCLEPPVGRLTATADYNLDLNGQSPQIILTNIALTLNGLALQLAGTETPFLELPDTRITKGRFDLAQRQFEIGKFAVKGGQLNLAKDESGTLNLQRLAAKSETSSPKDSGQAKASASGQPWKMTLHQFDLNGLALSYLDMNLNAGIGAIQVALKATAEFGGEQAKVQVKDLAVAVADLHAGQADAAAPAITLNNLALMAGAYNLDDNLLTMAEITAAGGEFDVQRQADGTINLAHLVASSPQETLAKQPEQADTSEHPFQFLADTVAISGLNAAFSDLIVHPASPLLNLENIAVTLTHVNNKSPMTFDTGFAIRAGGQIKATGTFDPAGPAVESELEVTALTLPVFQPYVSQAAAVILKSGTFSTKGSLRHGVKGAAGRTIYQGNGKIENLRVTETNNDETLVGWKAVQTEKMRLQLGPDKLEIDELRLVQPTGKFIIDKDRTLNLAKVMKTKAAPEKPEESRPQETADPFPYRIDRVRVSGGLIDFADFSLPTPFGTKIHELQGNVAGISSALEARAQIKLDGRVDNYGTANVDGELATANPKEFTDISVVFRNVEMSRLTPYSGKFAGRKIDSGKLSVDLKYKIDKGQLVGDNQLVVERLRLGDKVESPEAVDLPLDLAIALLQDNKGVIDLGLPVKGDLNSPEFSYSGLIWKAFTNLITKLVTSPFRVLGALLPGGGDKTMDRVAFAPGKAVVSPPEKEKLMQLAGVLEQRPQLKLVVQGRYEAETDLHELRASNVRLALAKRLKTPMETVEDLGPVDFSSPATRDALAAMFAERFGKEDLGAVKEETQAAAAKNKVDDPGNLAKVLFTRLLLSEQIQDTELMQLADARAQAVVVELNKIPPARLKIQTSAALPKGEKGPVTVALSLEAIK